MKKNANFILFLILLILPLSMVNGQKAKHFYKAGEDFVETGNYTDAVHQFTKAVELEPDFADAYLARAATYEKLNEPGKAAEDYQRATVFMDKSTDAFYHAARAYYNLGKLDEAMEYVEKAIELKRTNELAMQLKTKILLDQDNLEEAFNTAEVALMLKSDDISYYLHGLVNERKGDLDNAEDDYEKAIRKNKKFVDAYLSLAELQVKTGSYEDAFENCEEVLELNPNNTDAYLVRSKIHAKKLDYPNAINDLSKAILIDPDDPELFMARGGYYQEFTQHQSAINDFNKVILLDENNAEAYYQRAWSNEQIANFKAAIKDYKKLMELSEYDIEAKKLLSKSEDRLYNLNKEENKPEIIFQDPVALEEMVVEFPKGKQDVNLKGIIKDESELKYITIDSQNVPFVKNDEGYEFLVTIHLGEANSFSIEAADIYGNRELLNYSVKRTEIQPPDIKIIAPYASDNGEIYLDNDKSTVYVEGQIKDESKIKTILIDGVAASYKLEDLNPGFTANISIANKNKFVVSAIDVYGNETRKEFFFNKEGINIARNNPMGKTWAVFVENSSYQTFASLEGPRKDISLMKAALSKYKINNVIHKKDLGKKEMERFFTIELRDLVRANHVNTLMIWYAGHGKFINETGYWIPVDASRDDEFSYFNINSLKAALLGYTDYVTHTLVISDACESGPTFYQAMRDSPEERDCNDWEATKLRSSQVFSSAGYELALDNSQFTRTFANTLANNPNSCIPIEKIVNKVTTAVNQQKQQKPRFGKISGLADENGTFFFISKE